MNADVLKGSWKQIKGEIKKKWGQLTDDELDQMEGDQDKVLGALQKKYGFTKDQAREHWDDFVDDYEARESRSSTGLGEPREPRA